jgi:hypothetical protein
MRAAQVTSLQTQRPDPSPLPGTPIQDCCNVAGGWAGLRCRTAVASSVEEATAGGSWSWVSAEVQPVASAEPECNHQLVSPAGSGRARYRGGLDARVDRAADRSKWRWLIPAWLVGLGLIVVSGLLPSAVGYVVILGACVLLGAALGRHGGDPHGLRDHRQ